MRQKEFFNSNIVAKPFILFETETRIPFDWGSFPQALFPVISLFALDSHFHIKSCSGYRNTLDISTSYRGKNGHLYLHYNAAPDHRLIVSNIEFIHKRQGNMTQLFSILKQIRRSYSTGPIVIESVLSAEMEAWCKKNGFRLLPGMSQNYIWPS